MPESRGAGSLLDMTELYVRRAAGGGVGNPPAGASARSTTTLSTTSPAPGPVLPGHVPCQSGMRGAAACTAASSFVACAYACLYSTCRPIVSGP